MLDKPPVVVLNDAPLPPALGDGVLKRFVERGGGLLVVARRAQRVAGRAKRDLLPGTLGRVVDRDGRARRRRSASSTTAIRSSRCSRRRAAAISPPRAFFRYRVARGRARRARARAVRRWRGGGGGAAVGTGRVIAWTSTLDDSWNDLALKPVYPAARAPARAIPRRTTNSRRVAHGRSGARSRRVERWRRRGDAVGQRVVVTPSGAAQSTLGDRRARSPSTDASRASTKSALSGQARGRPRSDRGQHRSGRVRSDAARPARARRRGHRTRDADGAAAAARPMLTRGRSREAAGALVVSAVRRRAAARSRNGRRRTACRGTSGSVAGRARNGCCQRDRVPKPAFGEVTSAPSTRGDIASGPHGPSRGTRRRHPPGAQPLAPAARAARRADRRAPARSWRCCSPRRASRRCGSRPPRSSRFRIAGDRDLRGARRAAARASAAAPACRPTRRSRSTSRSTNRRCEAAILSAVEAVAAETRRRAFAAARRAARRAGGREMPRDRRRPHVERARHAPQRVDARRHRGRGDCAAARARPRVPAARLSALLDRLAQRRGGQPVRIDVTPGNATCRAAPIRRHREARRVSTSNDVA